MSANRVVLPAGEVSRRVLMESRGYRVSYTMRPEGKVVVVMIRRPA